MLHPGELTGCDCPNIYGAFLLITNLLHYWDSKSEQIYTSFRLIINIKEICSYSALAVNDVILIRSDSVTQYYHVLTRLNVLSCATHIKVFASCTESLCCSSSFPSQVNIYIYIHDLITIWFDYHLIWAWCEWSTLRSIM